MSGRNQVNNLQINLHALVEGSQANGPGLRMVLWLQGCTLGCPGCFNPQTHPVQGGTQAAVSELFARIQAAASGIDGLTISGGEPLQQIGPLTALLQKVRQETNLSVVVFTGFEEDELPRIPGIEQLLACVDVLVAGRYSASQRLARSLLGSANKRLVFLTSRYQPDDFTGLPEAEVFIGLDGEMTFTGIDPLGL